MHTLEAIKKRRAVNHFDSTHRMTKRQIRELMAYVLLSPTSFNIQNWRFVVITDPVLRKKIRLVSWGQSQMTDASFLVIFCADLNAWKSAERCWRNAPLKVRRNMVATIKMIYSRNKQLQRDEAIRSCGIAAQTLMLGAKAMGYDTCPMVGFDVKKVGKLIKLPKNHIVSMIIAVGKKIRDPWPRPGQLPLKEVCFTNQF